MQNLFVETFYKSVMYMNTSVRQYGCAKDTTFASLYLLTLKER